jgi:hypothetical protein
MAQARDSVSGVSLHLVTPPSSSSPNLGAPGLDSCAPNNETPQQARKSICQNSAFSPSPLVLHKYLDTPAKRLLIEFIEQHLQIEFQGFQPGFRNTPDLVLFTGPHRSTLAVPVYLISETQEIARAAVQEKILSAERKFNASSPTGEREEETGIAWG